MNEEEDFSILVSKEEAFSVWAPDSAAWSCWAKPVLFAHLDLVHVVAPAIAPVFDLNWAPGVEQRTALILDLPGPEGVQYGLALASRGYRPVPLYNAVPGPWASVPASGTDRPASAVDVLPIVSAIKSGALQLAQVSLPDDAPPAFLLDSNRLGNWRKMRPDEFDNRSVCFTTDFPSAKYLLAQGVQRILLVQTDLRVPEQDLAHILRRWQDEGLLLQTMVTAVPGQIENLQVDRPSWYGAMFQRALAAVGLRRCQTGGFGAWIPESASGG